MNVGSWWSTDGRHEIDIVTVAKKTITTVGTVKWRRAPLGREVDKNLAGHAQALGVHDAILLKAEPHVRGFSAEDLYR